MPWSQHYEPAPKDMSLTVIPEKELPAGVEEHRSFVINLREAHGYVNEVWLQFHFCHRCKGWIEGNANEYPVNNLDSSRLAGRQGTEYYCRRCGHEIAFFGLMS